MALQASGAISLTDIATEFGGTAPHSLSEYYSAAAGLPASGAITFDDFYGLSSAVTVTLSSSASNQNILTLAQAQGYNASTDSTPIIVNINSGVTISGSGTYALRTGALNANSDLTINISGNIDGFTGSQGSNGGTGNNGGSGGTGGDALYIETSTGGSATLVVNVLSGGKLRGGGGGGGGGGGRGGGRRVDTKDNSCFGSYYYGSTGSAGSAGSFGNSGSSGSSGSFPTGNIGQKSQSISAGCAVGEGSGGSGGSSGKAMRKNGRSVTVNNSGTVNGSIV